MKGKAKLVQQFLESKNITWQGGILYDFEKKKPRKANEKDFEQEKIYTIPVSTETSGTLISILATDNLFLVFDKDRTSMKADLSVSWNEFQKEMELDEENNLNHVETKEKSAKFKKYLNEEYYDIK